MQIPSSIPGKGFYYHYKHDPEGPVNNYAYEVIGVGFHTEDNCRPEDKNTVVYLPLYESSVYRASLENRPENFFDIRPLGMFMEDVTKDGKTFSRFQKITDPTVITELQAIKTQMYNQQFL